MTTKPLTDIYRDGQKAVLYPPDGVTFWGANTPTITNTDTQTYESGMEPVANDDGSWTYTLPAQPSPLTKRRIERVWVRDGRRCDNTRGDIVILDADFTGVIGAAVNDNTQWHLIWQMHGPGGPNLTDWRPPPVSIGVYGGRIWFEGGEGHPNNQYSASGYHKWRYDLGPWQDNVRHHVRIEIKVGNDPDGWVSCWFDGVKMCEKWRPRGYWPFDGGVWTDNYPGTIYSTPADAQADWVQNRSGLYRGINNGGTAGPTYVQWMRWWPHDVAPAHQP